MHSTTPSNASASGSAGYDAPSRSSRHRPWRQMNRAWLALASVAALVGSGAGLAVAAVTSGTAGAATTGYSGYSSAEIVGVNALDIPGTFDLANASVAPATAAVSSTGGLANGKVSGATATNLDVNLLSGAIPLDNLLVQAAQSAPPNNPTATTKQLLSLPANPLLDATLAEATAHARDITPPTCPAIGTPIADSSSYLANATVLNGVVPGTSTAVLAVDNAQGATVSTHSSVELASVSGQSTDGVLSTATTQLTAITLFKGTAEALTINVLAPPTITAEATGQPGGATVTYTEPILQVVQGGKVLGTLDAKDADLTLPLGIGHLSLGTLSDVTQASNGTKAAGNAVLLNVTVGGTGTPLPTVVNLSVAPLTANAVVPAGGVVCAPTAPVTNPLNEVHKDLSATVAYPSTPFQYTVVVPNRGTCTLTSVHVTDTISAPAGTTVTATSPTASSVNGLVTTWDDIGPLAPNETKNLVITVTPPSNLTPGAAFSNSVTVTGDCNGVPVSKTATISGPTGAALPTTTTCSLAGSNKAADHLQVFDGESFDYFIHVLNSSGVPCDGVTVTDTLGPNVSFVSCTGGCTASGSTVTWSIGTLAPGASLDESVTVLTSSSAATGTTLPNTATITPTNGSAQTVSTAGPTVTGTSVLAPPSPASPPPVTKAISPTPTVSPSPTVTSVPPTEVAVSPTPVTSPSVSAVSPTSVHTGLWFAGATPYLVGMLAFGLVLLGWPRIRLLAAGGTDGPRRS